MSLSQSIQLEAGWTKHNANRMDVSKLKVIYSLVIYELHWLTISFSALRLLI